MYPCVSIHHYHGYYLFSGGCGDGWTEYNGVCYYISASEVEEYTWREGRSWCMNKGGDLASVLSDEESQFIDQMVKAEGLTLPKYSTHTSFQFFHAPYMMSKMSLPLPNVDT